MCPFILIRNMDQTLIVSTVMGELKEILHRFKIDPSALVLAQSVAEWAKSVGLEEDNPFRIARAARIEESGESKIG